MTTSKVPGVDDAARAREVGKRGLRTFYRPESYPTLTASQVEFDALSSFLARGTSRVSSRVRISSGGMDGAFTLRLPDNPFGKFLNVQVRVLPSSQGLKLARVSVGKWPIPESLAIILAKGTADYVLGDRVGSLALKSIQSVSFTGEAISVSVSREPLARLRRSLKGLRKVLAPVSDPEAVRFYYGQLAESVGLIPGGESVSLAVFMRPLFQVVQLRSQDKDPVEENRAAILALAMYFGSWQFEALIGPVLTADLKASRPRNRNVVLAKRQDLRLHFIISAGLKIISDSGMGFAVGEFKELLDASHGGSGFSFVDLAADRAGIHFAEVATNSGQSARHLQQVLAKGEGESVFFPDIAGLPEGIDQGYFEGRYRDVQSSEYQRLVGEIDLRIRRLPLFKAEEG